MSTFLMAWLEPPLVALISRAKLEEETASAEEHGTPLLAVIQQPLSAHQGRLLGLMCAHASLLLWVSQE